MKWLLVMLLWALALPGAAAAQWGNRKHVDRKHGNRQLEERNHRVIGGAEVAGEAYIPWQWRAVRLLASAGGYCSGVFIDRIHLLTAAHCVRWDDGSDVALDQLVLHPEGVAARRLSVHPGFGNQSGPDEGVDYDFDLAIVEFPDDPTRVVARMADHAPEIGHRITIVGWGRSDEENDASGRILRYGKNNVAGFSGNHVEVDNGDEVPSPGRVILGSGDSGGAWFNEANELVGISSLGTMSSSSAVLVSGLDWVKWP